MFVSSESEKHPSLNIHAAEEAALQQAAILALNKLGQKAEGRIQNVAAATQQVIGITAPIMGTPPFASAKRSYMQTNDAPKSFAPVDKRGTSQDEQDVFAYTCADISIGNYKVKSFESFQLTQSTRTHHSFELVVGHNALVDENGKTVVEDEWLSATAKLLGDVIEVDFYYHIWPDKQRKFKGVITGIGYKQSAHGFGDIVFTGGSPTLLLDSAPHIQSFTAKSLKDVAKEVFRQGGLKVDENNIQPSYTSQLPYTCQHNETHYNYLARLAAHYGQCFFYDGENIRFGTPAAKPDVRLVLGRDVSDVHATMKGGHIQPVHYGYSSKRHTPLKSLTYEIKGMEHLGMAAIDASKKMYQTPALQVSPIRATLDDDVTVTQKSLATASAAEFFTVEGMTTNPYLFPGCHVVLEFRNPATDEKMQYAELIITDLKQTLRYDGAYSCDFTGVSFRTEHLPHPHFEMPKAEPQIAEVTDNNDEHYNQGRVRVKFPWQEEATDFIRVLTPDAGSSDKVNKNRGMVFIPEIGDQVMVGFVHGHPDRPYVMGSLFHGKVGGGGGVGNNVKSLTSKSGHTVRLDDGGGIHVKDKDNNTIHLDGAGNLTVTAKQKITLQTGEIDENGNPPATPDASIVMEGKNITLKGKDIKVIATGTYDVESTGNASLKSTQAGVSIEATQTLAAQGGISATLTSPKGHVEVTSGGNTTVKGIQVRLNC